jgi:hypothetical protein
VDQENFLTKWCLLRHPSLQNTTCPQPTVSALSPRLLSHNLVGLDSKIIGAQQRNRARQFYFLTLRDDNQTPSPTPARQIHPSPICRSQEAVDFSDDPARPYRLTEPSPLEISLGTNITTTPTIKHRTLDHSNNRANCQRHTTDELCIASASTSPRYHHHHHLSRLCARFSRPLLSGRTRQILG